MPQLIDDPVVPSARPPAPAEQWLELFGDRLYGYALMRVRHSHLAEDLVQETLLAAVQSKDRFENRSATSTWLIGILKKKIADHFRKLHARQGADESIPEEQAAFDQRGRWKTKTVEWRGNPEQIAESNEFQSVLQSCLAKLPSTTTQIFIGRVVDGTQTAELCGQLDITPDHAWTLLHRARLGLRQCLTKNWFAAPAARKN